MYQNMLRIIAHQIGVNQIGVGYSAGANKSVCLLRECCSVLAQVDLMPLWLSRISQRSLEAQGKNIAGAIKSGTFAVVGLSLDMAAVVGSQLLASWIRAAGLQSLHNLSLYQSSGYSGYRSQEEPVQLDLKVLDGL